jgi:metallophosphoesterase (TIGR00282 family)
VLLIEGTFVKILFIGDIVGKPGVDFVVRVLPALRRHHAIDLVVANAENADAGSGITRSIYNKLRTGLVDCITLGDHAYRKSDILDTLDAASDIIRPAHYPPEAAGRGWTIVKTDDGVDVAVVNLIGRVFMKPVDCPFRAARDILGKIPEDVVVRIVDFHAEATSDKQLMGRMLDGSVSMVLGTHTHVPTADEQILAGGTAFQCDVGMTGPHNGILGRDYDQVLASTMTLRNSTLPVASGDLRINGALVEVDGKTGKATAIQRIQVSERDAERLLNAAHG